MNKKLSDKEKEILKTLMVAIESRIKSGALQGGLTAQGIDFTLYYMVKYER